MIIKNGTYSAQEIADILGISAKRKDSIERSLKRHGISYSTTGRGKTLQFIVEQDELDFQQFIEEKLNIKVRNVEKFRQFLSLLFDKQIECPIVARCLEEKLETSRETIGDWIYKLEEVNILVEDEFLCDYYATKKSEKEFIDGGPKYKYIVEIKKITEKEYDEALVAYKEALDEYMKDYETNPDKIIEEGQLLANKARKAQLEGWWAMRTGTKNTKTYVINNDCLLLEELMDYLDTYCEYNKTHIGDWIDDMRKIDEQNERFKRQKKQRAILMKEKEQMEMANRELEKKQRQIIELDDDIKQKLAQLEELRRLQKKDWKKVKYSKGMSISEAQDKFIKENKENENKMIRDFRKDRPFCRQFILSLNGFIPKDEFDIKELVAYIDESTGGRKIESLDDIHSVRLDLARNVWKENWLVDFVWMDGQIFVIDIAETNDWESEMLLKKAMKTWDDFYGDDDKNKFEDNKERLIEKEKEYMRW